MTMHLVRGMSTISNRKTKIKLNKAEEKARNNALTEQRKLLKKVGIDPDRTIDPDNFRVSFGNEVVSSGKNSQPVTSRVSQPKQPAFLGNGGTKKVTQPKVYSGKKRLIGIAMMHKSNLVPVFSEEDAKEISAMRRG